MKPVNIIWWRFGKEHDPGGGTFRLNPARLVAAHLDDKLALQRAEPEDQHRCWQVDAEVLIERANPSTLHCGPDTRIYYLPQRGLAAIENIHFRRPEDQRWSWYIHMVRLYHDTARDCWIMQDLFTDLVTDAGCRDSMVVDLDDLATALDIGLVTPAETSRILRLTNDAVQAISRGEFPFPEIVRGREAGKALGW
jgi:hypothetical protein